MNPTKLSHRDELVSQVKEEYTGLVTAESQQHFSQTTTGITPESYYENILGMVLDEIGKGTFDSFHSGREIVHAVANDKTKWLSEWEEKRL